MTQKKNKQTPKRSKSSARSQQKQQDTTPPRQVESPQQVESPMAMTPRREKSNTPMASMTPKMDLIPETASIPTLTIENLARRIDALEFTVIKLKSELQITKKVNTILTEQLDNLQQYTRRPCVIVEGIPLSENETDEEIERKVKEKFLENFEVTSGSLNVEFDKCHRIGKIRKDKKNPQPQQSTIVRFKSHSFRSKLYNERKDPVPGNAGKRKNIRLRVSLTNRRSNLLNYASGVVEHFPDVFHFAYADPNGGLKLRLRKPVGKKYTYCFNSEADLDYIINELDLISINNTGEDF